MSKADFATQNSEEPNHRGSTPAGSAGLHYRERVLPSAASLIPVLLIFPTMYLMLLLISTQAGILLGFSVTVAVLASIWFAAPVIEISDRTFSVGDAELPIDVISQVTVIEQKDAFAERGVKLSPAAFTRFQVSVKQMVKLEISDEADPTPYWLIATRKPAEIARVLASAKK
ncbi:MAG: hypothetical protein RLY83_464 [Actinomycetota bacterium]